MGGLERRLRVNEVAIDIIFKVCSERGGGVNNEFNISVDIFKFGGILSIDKRLVIVGDL